jgi:hypothetical protein
MQKSSARFWDDPDVLKAALFENGLIHALGTRTPPRGAPDHEEGVVRMSDLPRLNQMIENAANKQSRCSSCDWVSIEVLVFESGVAFDKAGRQRHDVAADDDSPIRIPTNRGHSAATAADFQGGWFAAGVKPRARKRGFAVPKVESDDLCVLVRHLTIVPLRPFGTSLPQTYRRA